jgi:hypothetical protein
MEQSGRINLAVDLGAGREVDVEFGASDQLWVTTGQGLTGVDVWLKSAGQMIDLRVRVRRTETGVEVAVDRGVEELRWWKDEAVPRLTVALDRSAARAVASAGDADGIQHVLLGQVSI